MIGLGRMGAQYERARLLRGKHNLVVYDQNADAVRLRAAAGRSPQSHFLARRFRFPNSRRRASYGSWFPRENLPTTPCRPCSISCKQATPSSTAVTPIFVIRKRAARLRKRKASPFSTPERHSGGVWGLENGYCLMVGGDDAAVQTRGASFSHARTSGRLRLRRAERRGAFLQNGA